MSELILAANGVRLTRVGWDTLDQLRQIRNAASIRPSMAFQAEITAEQQQQWFATYNTPEQHYFLISCPQKPDTPLGVIHLNRIDWLQRTAEAGLYLHEEKDWGGPIPGLASLTLLEWAFGVLGLKAVWAKQRVANTDAARYNAHLGFSAPPPGLHPPEPAEQGFQWMCVQAAGFLSQAKPLRTAALRLYGPKWVLHLAYERADYAERLLQQTQSQPDGPDLPQAWERDFHLVLWPGLYTGPA